MYIQLSTRKLTITLILHDGMDRGYYILLSPKVTLGKKIVLAFSMDFTTYINNIRYRTLMQVVCIYHISVADTQKVVLNSYFSRLGHKAKFTTEVIQVKYLRY